MHLAEMHTLGVKVDFSRKDFLYWLVLSVFYQKIGNVLINLFIFCISTQRVSCPSKPKSFNCLSRVNFLFFLFIFFIITAFNPEMPFELVTLQNVSTNEVTDDKNTIIPMPGAEKNRLLQQNGYVH